MNLLMVIARTLLFPGIVFTVLMSLWLSGFDRKVVARMQKRVGPPLTQPLWDYLKFLGKETIIPRKANKTVFLAAPLIGVATVLVIAMFIPIGSVQVWNGTNDMIVILYLLTLASVTLIVGSAASGSPFAGVGLSREMVAMISYELPFVLVILAIAKLVSGSEGLCFSLSAVSAYQASNGFLLSHWTMIPAAIAMLFVIPVEVGQQPFDIDEAETEICEGVLAEYSGKPLACFKMMHYIKMYIMSGLFVALFLNIQTGTFILDLVIYIVLCTLVTFVSMSLPHAICARFKVEQVFQFYWTYVTGFALISLILVFIGL